MSRNFSRAALCGACMLAWPTLASAARAQERRIVDSLVQHALVVNPRLLAADDRAGAARSRISAAGAWPDPMLMAGIQNLPLSRVASGPGMSAGADPMTMKMFGVGQTIPYPGKTSLRTAAARAEADAASARLQTAQREVTRDVLHAYYDLAEARTLLNIVERQQQVAFGVLPAAAARYVSGSTAQADVIEARTEAAMLAKTRNAMVQQERAALARLNVLLDRPSGAPVVTDSLSEELLARAGGMTLDSLQALALRSNPRLREHRSIIAAQSAQAELARRDYLPDFDVSLQYGQREARPDMITAMISVPLAVQRGRKQSATARAAHLELTAAEAELRAEENAVRSDVAQAYAAVERHRANLSLVSGVILPQARATFASASATYQPGRGELFNVLDAMRAMFGTETMYVRTLADLGRAVAELHSLVGWEAVR